MLRPLVPDALEIDTFEGDAFIGVVPFTMTNVRPLWVPPVPGISNFHETNVRTYVHHEGKDPGVWFLSLDAASRLAVWVARTFWHLPYHSARMALERGDGTLRYSSTRRGSGAKCELTCRPVTAPAPATPGTLEHFLAERYLLFADTGRGLRRGQVHHTPYPLQVSEVTEWDESLIAALGLERPAGEPIAHYAERVQVEIFGLTPLRGMSH